MITTEKATDARDLPHTYDPPDGGLFCKLCGRTAGHELHLAPTPAEQAAEAPKVMLERELGS